MRPIFVADGPIFIQIRALASKGHIFSAPECVLAVQVIQGRWFWYQSKACRLCDFLL